MNYPGGKNAGGAFQTIINQMPPHDCYIEAFAGSAAVLRMKRPALGDNIAIDRDADVVSQLRSALPSGAIAMPGDAFEILRTLPQTQRRDTLVYLDPPYLLSTRRTHRQLYRCELTTVAEHTQLLTLIKALPCMVILSGYWSKLYADMLDGWRTVTYSAVTRGGCTATEWLWMNYPEPLELHDYRYLGGDFRERERIKRKRLRWTNKLHKMPPIERHCLIQAIEQMRCAQHTVSSFVTTMPPETSPETSRVATIANCSDDTKLMFYPSSTTLG